jgi:hypothetical protein
MSLQSFKKLTWYNQENCWTNKSFTCLPLRTDDHILEWHLTLPLSVIEKSIIPPVMLLMNSDWTGDLSLLCYKPDFVTSLFVINKLYCISDRLYVWLHVSDRLYRILSTKIVIFSYPKLLSFSVLTFIKWRLTPSYAAKDTIFWQKRPKTIVIRIIVLDDNKKTYKNV